MQRNIEKCREMQRKAEKCREMQKNAAKIQKYREMQIHVKKCGIFFSPERVCGLGGGPFEDGGKKNLQKHHFSPLKTLFLGHFSTNFGFAN